MQRQADQAVTGPLSPESDSACSSPQSALSTLLLYEQHYLISKNFHVIFSTIELRLRLQC
jgi:hypothetical protein